MPANDLDLDMLAGLAGLDIPPEYRDGVATQFQALRVQAELVLSFPLAEELEPAPVFTP
jgi:hypothetical protein